MEDQNSEDIQNKYYLKDLTDRHIYSTPIGPVCMSQREFEDYQELLELRQGLPADAEASDEHEKCKKIQSLRGY